MSTLKLHRTIGCRVGPGQVGGGAPVVVQSMTMTDTADAKGTAQQCIELAEAGSEMVRVTVNVPEAAAAVPEIKQRMLDAGVTAPLIGDFHYNGHVLLTKYPACAAALDKYRINPGNVGAGQRRDEQFSTICHIARDMPAPRLEHYFVPDVAPPRSHYRVPRLVRQNRAASASRIDRSRHGHE